MKNNFGKKFFYLALALLLVNVTSDENLSSAPSSVDISTCSIDLESSVLSITATFSGAGTFSDSSPVSKTWTSNYGDSGSVNFNGWKNNGDDVYILLFYTSAPISVNLESNQNIIKVQYGNAGYSYFSYYFFKSSISSIPLSFKSENSASSNMEIFYTAIDGFAISKKSATCVDFCSGTLQPVIIGGTAVPGAYCYQSMITPNIVLLIFFLMALLQ